METHQTELQEALDLAASLRRMSVDVDEHLHESAWAPADLRNDARRMRQRILTLQGILLAMRAKETQ
jgi:hypothetical protein